MKCLSKDRRQKTEDRRPRAENRPLSSVIRPPSGFTLVESMAATALLAFIGASVWVTMERCMVSAVDSTQRLRAFEVARENMEKLLGTDGVQEMTEYGISENFPDIHWQTTVESFYEPVSSAMWVRAVCFAEYTDASGETQRVELTHWLTDLNQQQMQQMMAMSDMQKQMLARYLIETDELAAQYAGVSVETIRQWVQNGMPTTSDGAYLKPWLDTYFKTDGNPTAQDKQDTIAEYPGLSAPELNKPASQATSESDALTPEDIDFEFDTEPD